jgi:translocation and assembly module TamB
MLGLNRRALVALVSAALMLGLGAAVIGGLAAATQSEGGREWIRRVAEAQLERAFRGKVHLGKLSGSFLTDLRTDSLLITDLEDSVFVASGPLRVTFDPRDLADGRIILRSLDVQRPYVAVRRETGGAWTHEKIFPRRPVRRALRRRTAFGAVFVIEQARVRDGDVALLLPWAPDSAPRDVRTREWRWENIALDVPRARLAYPDSVGRLFDIARLDADESDPPFAFRNVSGSLLMLRDTARVELSNFSLPGSQGRAVGRITWGRDQPPRYAFRIDSDSVALADIAWINPAIPTEGGGRMRLDIRNNPRDPEMMEYVISQMDVRSHASRLRGQMTWGVKGSEVALRNVDLEMAPLDAELITRFNQGPLPIPLRGRIIGRLRGRGGPLTAFVVEDATATFVDGNVPGATSRLRARGTLDISDPAYPVFLGVNMDVGSFDLRTAQALEPALPKLNGTLSGSARLDSVWGDLRLSDADITHRDGDGPSSRLVGRARVSWDAASPLRWDLDGQALPISFTTLARSFPELPLRGEYEGPLRTTGTSDDFTLATALAGPAGRFDADVRLDNALPNYRVVGQLRTQALDPRLLLDDPRAPEGELNGRVSADIGFEELADLIGNVDVDLERSTLNGVRIYAGSTRLTFGFGLARLDTLALETSAVDVAGTGALGLTEAFSDTLRLRIRMDSLGGLRPLLSRPAGDSLTGAALVNARLHGWVKDFAVDATATASGILYAGNDVKVAAAQSALRGFPGAPSGSLQLQADTLLAGGLGLRSLRADATLAGSDPSSIRLRAVGDGGTNLWIDGSLAFRNDSTLLRADSLRVETALHAWQLQAPVSLFASTGGFRVDSLALRAGERAGIDLAGGIPAEGAPDLRLRGRNIPMADVAELLQRPDIRNGQFDVNGEFSGTRAAPAFDADGELRGGLLRGVRLDTLRTRIRAVSDRVYLQAALGPSNRADLTAEGVLPLRLDLNGAGIGMEADGPVSGRIAADSLDLRIFEMLTRGNGGTRGSMQLALDLSGTWARPRADGVLRVRNGVLAPAALGGVRWRGLEAEVGFVGDSVAIRSFSVNSAPQGAARGGRATLGGWIALADRANPRMDLRLTSREFNVYAVPGTADIDLSGDLRLAGSWSAATLSGALTADRAIIGIPELASKDVISLEGPDRFGVEDTLILLEAGGAVSAPPAFIENLTVANVPIRMGRDVWIRSSEANINLGGQVSVTRGRITRGPNAGQVQLAVTGPLQTLRGTYRLNLGPVQRTFTVEQGEIRFFGDPELNPSLNISALHTVRQYSEGGVRPDVRVRVHLGGTLRQPTAELSTPDSMRVTNSDLISYLVTGGPSYEIARDGNVTSTAARVLLGSVGSVLGNKVAGGLCDDAQLTTAGLDAYQGGVRDVGGSILSGSRFNCAKQVGDRAFVRLDAGLCGVGQLVSQNSGGNPLSLGDALGVKFDYLLGSGFSASFGLEPRTSATLCSSDATNSARGFVPTPRQIGVDLFRAWRF